MEPAILVILVGAAVAALVILILRLGKRLAIFLLALGGLGVAGAVAFALAEQARATRQAAQAATIAAAGQATAGAALSIIAFLLGVIVILVLGAAGAFFGWRVWKRYQKRSQWEETVRTAQLYALLNGARLPVYGRRGATPHPALPYTPALGSGSVIVLPTAGQQYPSQPGGITLEDLARALQAAQGRGYDPFAELLPPEGGMWEVVE
jgi:hypothetical protein